MMFSICLLSKTDRSSKMNFIEEIKMNTKIVEFNATTGIVVFKYIIKVGFVLRT